MRHGLNLKLGWPTGLIALLVASAAVATALGDVGVRARTTPASGRLIVGAAFSPHRRICFDYCGVPSDELLSVSPSGGDPRVVPGCAVASHASCSAWTFSPDRKLAAFSRKGQLLVAQANGRNARLIGPYSGFPDDSRWFAWSPGSRSFAYLVPPPHPHCFVGPLPCGGGDVYVERADGTHRHRLTHEAGANAVGWPAPGEIVYTAARQIMAVDPHGRNARSLDAGPVGALATSDRGELAFDAVTGTARPDAVVIEHANRTRRLQLEPIRTRCVYGTLKWSPDGRWLSFVGSTPSVPGNDSLFIVRRDGKQLHRLLGTTPSDGRLALGDNFTWSPDSTRLAVLTTAGIVTMRRDGADRKRVRTGLAHGFRFWLNSWGSGGP